jgi:mRNA-degrading endonuclease RelE of RelBE toxin-antitoxin system
VIQFRIADTFTDSLARLTGDEQKAVKTTAFDLQMNPANPGMQFHKLDRARDKNFWSVRVSADIRIIVHKSPDNLLLCYVDHHDKAYQWTERRKLEIHPKTGAVQLVEIRETVKEIVLPKYIEVERAAAPKPALFTGITEETLLGYGVPAEWLGEVRAADEDTILDLAGHLPAEAAEVLLELAVGGIPIPPTHRIAEPAAFAVHEEPGKYTVAPVAERAPSSPFEHPDAQRRFRLMQTPEELTRALDYPWEKWLVFLHPEQRELVERDYDGPARISGSAGTGKTIVALHRAVWLARRYPDARVLLTTFSATLANALRTKLRRLLGNEPRLGERLEVYAVEDVARRLYESHLGAVRIADRNLVAQLLREAAGATGDAKITPRLARSEWEQIVDAWQLTTWEAYRDAARLGRKTRLPEKQLAALWAIFESMRAELKQRELVTLAEMYHRLAAQMAGRKHPPFDHIVVDEAQDVSAPQLEFLAALGGQRPNGLFFTGDLGQRIFQEPFSWRNELAIVIRRYDRRTGADRLVRIHQEDACQALGMHPAHKYENEGGPGIFRIMDLLNQSSRAVEDRRRFMAAIAFNYLIMGTDAHAKNYSLLLGEGGRVRLAPFYDLASLLPYQRQRRDERFAMRVGGYYQDYRIQPRHFERTARQSGYPPGELMRQIGAWAMTLPEQARELLAQLGKEGIKTPVLRKLVDGLEQRCKRLRRIYPVN